MDKAGEDWNGLHLRKFGKRRADVFCKFNPVYIEMPFTLLENHSHLLCGRGLQMEDSALPV